MEKKRNRQSISILYYFFVALIAICTTRKLLPNDIFFTIPCGQNILDNGFSTVETLTYHQGLTFIDVRWLFDVTYTMIHNIFGFNGVYIMTIIFSIMLFESIFILLNKLYKKPKISFLITLISNIYIHIYIVPRAQIVSALIFVWEYYSIIQLLNTNKKRYYISLIVLAIVLVNVHATLFPIYLLLFLPFIAEFIISKLRISNKFMKITFDNSRYYKNLIALFMIVLLAGFVSPYPGTAYTVMFKTMSGKTNRYIGEMQLLLGSMLYMWLIYISIFCILGNFKTHIKASNLFVIIGLSMMALYANRGFLIFVIITNYPLCELLVSCYNSRYYFIFKEKIPKLDLILKIIYYFIICMALLTHSLLLLYNNIFNYKYISTETEPVFATQYLLEEINLDDYVLYNGFNYGSYLEYFEIKSFMDSRAEVFERPYNDVDIMYDNSQMEKARSYEELQPYIEKYNFDLFLVNNEFTIYHTMMDNPEHFELLHLDDYFAIFKLVDE